MATTCIACNNYGTGMINIFNHPNKLDSMFSSLTGIQVQEVDALCILCYDELKVAYNFRQKCIQNKFLRDSSGRICADGQQYSTIEVQPTLIQLTNRIEEEISTTTIATQQYSNKFIDQEYSTTEEAFESSTNYSELIIQSEETKPTSEQIHEVTENETQEEENEMDDQVVEEEEEEELDEDDDKEEDEDDEDEEEVYSKQENELKKETEAVSDKRSNGTKDLSSEATSPRLKCSICDKIYAREKNLENHIAMHEKKKVAVDAESSISKRTRTSTNRSKSEFDIYKGYHELMCEFCFQEFTSLTDKMIHIKIHENSSKPYKCNYENCGATFKLKHALRKHYHTHCDEKKFACRFCDKKFRQRGNCVSHERIHTGEKPFVCVYCEKGFTESGNLKTHIRSHSGERPFSCPKCPMKFKTHYSHKIHIRSHTMERPYPCDDCGKKFISSGKLLVHKRTHTGEKPYKCENCVSSFTDCSGLKRHTRLCHINSKSNTGSTKM